MMQSLLKTELQMQPRSAPALVSQPVVRRIQGLRVYPVKHSLPSSSQQDRYEYCLELSRQEHYHQAREAFEALLEQHPRLCKAWVSYAQMERRLGRTHDPLRMEVARQILQRGLQRNPDSGCLAQAWGLMELQKGNMWAAIRLLERSVLMDPVLEPVLKWKHVSKARMALGGGGGRSRIASRLVCASAGGCNVAVGSGSATHDGTYLGQASGNNSSAAAGNCTGNSCMSS